jgi:hypothetical protein
MEQFLGYAESQLKRLYNERSKDVNRPAGDDTKFAMHAFDRLLGMKEFVERGEITLTQPDAAELIQIRLGEYELSELVAWANQLQQEAGEAKGHSPLPEKVDKTAVLLLARVRQDFLARP